MSNDNSEKRILSVCAIYQDGKYWPFIRLQGRWLQRLGFEAGSMVEVEYIPGLLLIRLLPTVPCRN
ncbi:MAG: SymE family type I addiction module toxin [Bacillota bacterium]